MAFDYTNYYELEYIGSSGSQYIKTSINSNIIGRIVSSTKWKSTSRQCMLGCWQGRWEYSYLFYVDSNKKVSIDYEPNESSALASTFNVDTSNYHTYDIDFINSVYKYDDSTLFTLQSGFPTANRDVWLFCSNDSSEGAYIKASADVEYLRIYDHSGNLIYDFTPAKRKNDGVLGLYETVNGIFYTNDGTGTFTGGKRVSQDFDYNNYYELNYLQSSGTQYIDSGFCDGNGVLYDFKVEFPSLSSSTSIVFGTTSSSYRQYLGFTTSSTILGLGTGSVSPSHSYQSNVPYVCSGSFKKGQISVVVNNESVYSATTSPSYSNSHTLYIFGTYNHNNNTVTNKSTEKLYYLNLYDTNGVLERGLIPAERKSDGVLGYFDVVYGVFYTNIGSGTFISGGRIQYVIATAVSPTGSGSISGGGTYYKGETAVLIATANSGFGFLKWNDETTSTTKTFTVFNDASYTAYFYALIVITLTYDSRLGSASYVWNGVDSITLTATPNRYGSFDGWYINNVLLSTDNPYIYTPTQDITIEARFSAAYDWIDPITDRTQADITAKNSKAYINYGDLNRIEKDTIYLCYLLHEEYPALDNLTVKTNWVRTDIPSVNNMERIRSNAETILRTLYPTDSIQTFGNQFNFENANDIEGALLTIYEEVNNA